MAILGFHAGSLMGLVDGNFARDSNITVNGLSYSYGIDTQNDTFEVIVPIASTANIWGRFHQAAANWSTRVFWEARDVSGDVVVELSTTATPSMVAKIRVGGVLTQVAEYLGTWAGQFDINIFVNASGTINVYSNGGASPVLTYTGDLTDGGAYGAITTVDFNKISSSSFNAHGPFLVSDDDSRLYAFQSFLAQTAGTNSDWSGAVTAVDEAGGSFNDFITSLTAGQVSTYNIPAHNAIFDTGYTVEAILVGNQTRSNLASGRVRTAMVTGATSYFGADTSISTGGDSVSTLYTTNPNTAVAWTNTDIDNLQIGVASVAP
jgi:hypothetical protein